MVLTFCLDAGAQKPDSVRVWTEPMVIPTYELGQDDPNPYFARVMHIVILHSLKTLAEK